jgi:phosphopantetheine--protein transferase-like protein
LAGRRARERRLARTVVRRIARKNGRAQAENQSPQKATCPAALARIRESYRPRPIDVAATVILSRGFDQHELPRWYLQPALGADEVAVWRLPPKTPRPIEAAAAPYLGVSPESVRVARGPTGKPELEGSNLAVSLVHSGAAVLVAIASAGDVGVDVEVLGRDITDWELVEQALTKGERDRLQALPDGERTESFLRSWTRKEAILKAAGTGLGIDPRLAELDELEIVAVPAELGKCARMDAHRVIWIGCVPVDARMCAKKSSEAMPAAISRRLRSFQAGWYCGTALESGRHRPRTSRRRSRPRSSASPLAGHAGSGRSANDRA